MACYFCLDGFWLSYGLLNLNLNPVFLRVYVLNKKSFRGVMGVNIFRRFIFVFTVFSVNGFNHVISWIIPNPINIKDMFNCMCLIRRTNAICNSIAEVQWT